ncbi:sensor histidine kinase [Marinisporobacter balticus]|uniref:histidine kinase n=1 Tax=Marinisporobacter balticus TaxID=2018667 RepID=A0A4R2KX35_9FIRM|nr:HAMP domain-containing sensor histidine kinase [Marinisporobacter balticus]TCO77437.1 PAS domain S-box-containing protein [Marinisporobacter balticus]
MKLSIKKKIIWPLLLLMIMPTIALSILTYWNNYKIINNYAVAEVNNELNDLLVLLNGIEKTDYNKEFIINYIKSLNKKNLFIIEEDDFIYNSTPDKSIDEDKILNGILNDKEISDRYILNYRVYHQWNWKIGLLIDKKEIPYTAFSMNGNILLLITLLVLFSFEAIILITDNISKPIGILLNGYNDIISGNFQNEIDIKRKDELGLLGDAFNDMKNEIANRTNKFIQLKNFNEDILRSISTGIITTNINGKILKYNQAAIAIIEKEIQSQENNLEIIKVLLRQIMSTVHTEETINRVENFQSKEEGKNVYLDITTSLMKNIKGENIGVICNFNDISNRKRIEDKIDRIDRLASLGQLTAGLAHEIRNPLSGMKMSCQVLKNRLSKYLNETDEKLFDANIHEVDRLNSLITDLLNFAKPHLPKFQVVNIYEILEHALQFSNKIISEKKISVLKEEKSNYALAYFDKGQLAQIFLNIIGNAIKAMSQEGILEITVSKEDAIKKQYMLMVFEDNGCGIDKENIPKIFDPFYTTYESGTGLGLSVVHKLITANHGEIEVESQVAVGTKIKLYIPLYKGEKYEEESINH